MNDNLLIVLTVFVGLCTISMVTQMVVMVGMYLRFKSLQEQIRVFTPRVEQLLESAQKTLEQSRKQITEVSSKVTEVTSKANEVLDSTRTNLGRVEEVLVEATTRAKAQIERVDLVLEDTITRVHESVAMLHNGVLRPLKEINGVSAGVRAGIRAFLSGKRPSVAQATHDEEMFI